jgi:hypothetical protein
LEVATHTGTEDIEGTVKYIGDDGRYTVESSRIRPGIADGSSPAKLHKMHGRIVRRLTTPGKMVDGNEEPVSLQGSSP